MYSPFFDKKGKPLTIEKLKYNHLEQLFDCDEGHHLEYKLLLEDGGKAQLAKEIASFANCEGGWLIVGIDDKTKDIIPIEYKDYSQKIGKIATRITPMPEFETRFLRCPEDKTKGVLIVYVYEGNNAPYICNGSVYLRSGSSKEPIKTADRGNIEYLYERSNSFKKKIEDFCCRDYYYKHNDIIHRKATYPIATIYLKNISSKKEDFFNRYENRDAFIDYIIENYSDVFKVVSYSMNSIILKQSEALPGTNCVTFVFEIFYDWSCKIYAPFLTENEEERKSFINIFESIGINSELAEKFKLINGSFSLNSLYFSLILFSKIAKKYKLKEKNYAFCVEIENAEEVITVFWGNEYKEYVSKYGIPYAHKKTNKSEIYYLRDYNKVSFADLPGALIADKLSAALGIRSDSIFKLIKESNENYI